jgi:hypothetical protein
MRQAVDRPIVRDVRIYRRSLNFDSIGLVTRLAGTLAVLDGSFKLLEIRHRRLINVRPAPGQLLAPECPLDYSPLIPGALTGPMHVSKIKSHPVDSFSNRYPHRQLNCEGADITVGYSVCVNS